MLLASALPVLGLWSRWRDFLVGAGRREDEGGAHMAHLADVAIGRADPTDAADLLHHGGHWTQVNRCVEPDARPGFQPRGPDGLPDVFPDGLPASSGVPEGPARVGWLLRFQVVTLVVAAILCGLATVALLALSWSFFALGARLAPCGVRIPLFSFIHVIAIPVAGTV